MEQLRQVFYGQGSPVNMSYDRIAGFNNGAIRNREIGEFGDQMDKLEATHPGAPARAMAVGDSTPKNAKILIKGMPQNPGPEVPRQFIEVLNPARKPFEKGSGRAELAEEIASKNNPLTARVLAFQVAHGLKADGVVGATTFMQVNRLTGVTEPNLEP